MADISSQQWQVSPSTLYTPSRSSCIVKHRNDLIVIGGVDVDDNRLKDVSVINMLTGESVLAGTLSVGTSDSACILHRSTNTLHIFGGREKEDGWQFINLPTVDPTKSPTQNPTLDPTSIPTKIPTTVPTRAPSSDPTEPPSADPTHPPSTDPTHPPSTDPSHPPSTDPTDPPSADSTDPPSSDPTHNPNNIATDVLTVNYTIYIG
eukprot:966940_1